MKKRIVLLSILSIFSGTLFLSSCGDEKPTQTPTSTPVVVTTPTQEERVYVDNTKSYIKLSKDGSSNIPVESSNITIEVKDKDGNTYTNPYNSVFILDETKYSEYSSLSTNKEKQEWLENKATESIGATSLGVSKKPGKYYVYVRINGSTAFDYYYTNPYELNIVKKDITIEGISDATFYVDYTFPVGGNAVEKVKLSDFVENNIHIANSVQIPGLNMNIGHFEFVNPNEEVDFTNNGETKKIKYVLDEQNPNDDFIISDYYTSNKEYDIKLVLHKGTVVRPHALGGYNNLTRTYDAKNYDIIYDSVNNSNGLIDIYGEDGLIDIEGDQTKINAGSYNIKFALKNSINYEWSNNYDPNTTPELDQNNKISFDWSISKGYSNINDYLWNNKHFVSPTGTWNDNSQYKIAYNDLTSPSEDEEFKLIPQNKEIEFYIEYDENLLLADQYKFIIFGNNNTPFYGYPIDKGWTYHFENELVAPSNGKISNKVIIDTIGDSNWFDIRFSVEAVENDNISGGESPNGQLITVKGLIDDREEKINNIKPFVDNFTYVTYSVTVDTKKVTFNPQDFLNSIDFTNNTELGVLDNYKLEIMMYHNNVLDVIKCPFGTECTLPEYCFHLDQLTAWWNANVIYEVNDYTEVLRVSTFNIELIKEIPNRTNILNNIKDGSETSPLVITPDGTSDFFADDFLTDTSNASKYSIHYLNDNNEETYTMLTNGVTLPSSYADGNIHLVTIKYYYDSGYETLSKNVYVRV